MQHDSEREASPLPVLARVASSLVAIVFLLFTAAWAYRTIGRRNHPTPSGLPSVASLDQLGPMPFEWLLLLLVGLLAAGLLVRRPALANPRLATLAGLIAVASVGGSLIAPFGYYATIVAASLIVTFVVVMHLPAWEGARAPAGRGDRLVAGGLWLAITAIMCVFSMYRHSAYGSGSWDMGCMIHNFYRSSHFLNSTSTVLGDVDYLGDHFMIGIYLYAPLYWINSSGYMLLLIQSVNMAATAPAIYLIARHRGAPTVAATAIAIVTGLSFGVQSGAYFDSHEITVGFGFLAWGLWAFERGKLKTATLMFGLFALFKESLGAYVVALGMLAVWRGLRGGDDIERSRWIRYGLLWIVGGAIWFVLVNRLFIPVLRARANAPEPHETFGDFGPTVFTALIGIVTQPMKAFAAFFMPSAKVHSQLVTLGGVGFLALASPQVALAALPLIAERFLSTKQTMWQMGYHYAAPLSLYAGWAVAAGWPRIERGARWGLNVLGGLGHHAATAVSGFLLASMLFINGAGYFHPANFLRWRLSYFPDATRAAAYDAGVELLKGQGRDARLAAQNRILPHLADRPVIYRLQDWAKADYVLLAVGENAWPKDDGYPRRLALRLQRSPEWRLVFAQANAAVFARSSVSELPAVAPTPELGLVKAKPAAPVPPPPPPQPAPP